MGTDEADGCFYVLNLCGEFGVAAGTVVDAHDSKACVGERFAQGHIGHALHVVGEPCTAVDGDDDFVRLLMGAGQIDVEPVCLQVVSCIVYILILWFYGCRRETAEALWLCPHCDCEAKQHSC